MSRQSSLTSAMDERFYPFTEIHPYRPWYSRIRVLTLGETVLENQERLRIRDHILRDVTAITLEDTRLSGAITPASAVGVGVKPISSSFLGALEAAQTWAKIKSIPSTPVAGPSNLEINIPESLSDEGGVKSWDAHKVDKASESITESIKTPLPVGKPIVFTTSKV